MELRGMRNRREMPDWSTPSVISFERNVMTELKIKKNCVWIAAWCLSEVAPSKPI